jgi:uncharacterized protein
MFSRPRRIKYNSLIVVKSGGTLVFMLMKNSDQVDSRPPRNLPARQMPPYSYVSGKFPHPLRDTEGHSFGVEVPRVSIPTGMKWRECEPYLWGIDLFNNGYYWEAHENWETVWHATGRRGAMADFCKALIKFAAAGVKAREGRTNGVQRHARRALQLLENVEGQIGSEQPTFMGLSLQTLKRYAAELIGNPSAIINTSDDPVIIVMPFAFQIKTDDATMPLG